MAADQAFFEDEDLEHRLRVREYLNYVQGMSYAVFLTKHGLEQHLRNFHLALKAVEMEACMDLLGNEHIIELLSQVLTVTPHPDADQARLAPPDLLLAPGEVIHQLARLGLLRLVTHNPGLRMQLSLHCQVCGSNFPSPLLLMEHLCGLHAQALADAEAWIRMLSWVMFSAHGCLCNPAVNHGTPGHRCSLIYNLALMINNCESEIFTPWHYRAVDLLDVLEPYLPEPMLSKVSTLMMTRCFEDVMMSTEVYQLLTQRCIICDTQIPLNCARTHIRVAHNFDIRSIEVIINQLAKRASQTHFDHWCTFCGMLLPYDLEDEHFSPCPEQHLKECDYIALIAMLLSYPVWYKKPYAPDTWPTADEVQRGKHDIDLQLMQFNVFAEQLHRNSDELLVLRYRNLMVDEDEPMNADT